ncbi:hypothetical protein [Pseudomonas oryzicola]|nr:hypothetical protein [Pseudomonas oryzicola]
MPRPHANPFITDRLLALGAISLGAIIDLESRTAPSEGEAI